MQELPSQSLSRKAAAIAAHIQSTLVSNCVTREEWDRHVSECLHYRFQAAMVPPAWVRQTADRLRGSGIIVASWIDMPFGTMTSRSKAETARDLAEQGAQEIDLMPNVGFLVSGMERQYHDDIRGVVEAAGRIPIKIMLEMPLLNAAQVERAALLSVEAGAAFLKNASSGAVGVATPDQIRVLRRLAPSNVRVKASGGIKTALQVQNLLDAGADLVGSSAGAQIVEEILGISAGHHTSDSGY